MLSCSLFFHTLEPCPRRGEPVTVGLPWPRGAVKDDRCLRLIGPDGTEQVLQTKVLDRWPDGSVRWCLFDFLATWDGQLSRDAESSERSAASGYRIEVGNEAWVDPPAMRIEEVEFSFTVEQAAGAALVDQKHGTLRLPNGVSLQAKVEWPGTANDSLLQYFIGRVDEQGPLRTQLEMTNVGNYPEKPSTGCVLFSSWRYDFFSSANVCRMQIRVWNSVAADHPGGNWDLGNGGSIFFNRLRAVLSSSAFRDHAISITRGAAFQNNTAPFSLRQFSSGGDNWQSTNHVTNKRTIGPKQRGYQTAEGNPATRETGSRATPILIATDGERFLGLTSSRFWEEFPKEVVVTSDSLSLDLFPYDAETPHELQGGEQKTHTFYVAFGRDTITDDPMVWCRSPTVVHASPEWYASSGAIPYLTPKATDPHVNYLTLVDQAIEGPDTFLHKREKIDEYGWRNFGDIYGDHEAVFHQGETPLISHYNNQYDCVAGFFYQYFRSGDLRWLTQGLECADHTCDIDIYHTDGDKAAYNHGLFWHTYHYADADTGTHRSYPKSITRGPVESLTQKMEELGETAKHLKKSYAVGGGPASSNNYNTGLMLAYFLTGNPLYRDGALELANYVLSIEDPEKTPFRYLSLEFTGLASESGGGAYHGPGRGPANSINALLVGHQLTGDAKYLQKAEQLIRRVAHPKQNLERLDLLNAELRWFYTMTLQAIGRYLDHKIELDQLDDEYAYARLTLLHYAGWMAIHERPILDTPEKLQYPTETWAAQDMRKVEVFQFAAKHATGEERAKFLERAEWFFDYVSNKLHEFETKSLCRPVILMMTNGWSRNWWRLNPDANAPLPLVSRTADDFGEWRMFVPQKVKAIRRAKLLLAVAAVAVLAVTVRLALSLFM